MNTLKAMSRLTPSEVHSLREIAHEIRETWSARGHNVGTALATDGAFVDTQVPRSALIRALIMEAFGRGARMASVGHENGPGGSKEVHTFNGSVEHIFRLLKATVEDGEYIIAAKDDAMLRDLEITLMGRQERWVFAYTVLDEDLHEIFAAEVLGVEEGSPGRLILGPIVLLEDTLGGGPRGGFQPAPEDLDLGHGEAAEGDEGFSAWA